MRYSSLACIVAAAAWAAGPDCAAVSAEGLQPAKASATAPASALTPLRPIASQPVLASTQPAGGLARNKRIKGSWEWDIDTDKDGKEGTPDVWWSTDRGERFLNPRNGAGFVIIADRAFDKIGRQDLEKLNYEKQRLSAVGPGAPLNEGTVLGMRTSRGNFAKVQIVGFEDVTGRNHAAFPRLHIKLRYVLYEVPGAAEALPPPPQPPPVVRRDTPVRKRQRPPAPPPLERSGQLIP